MTTEQISEEIARQINLGFSTSDIQRNMSQKGLDMTEVDAVLEQLIAQQVEAESNRSVRLYSILAIGIGILFYSTLQPVSGGLKLPFETSGDLIRWRELFIQPWGSIFLIVFGFVQYRSNRKARSKGLRVTGMTWFFLLAFLSAYSNNVLNMLAGIAAVVVMAQLTKSKE